MSSGTVLVTGTSTGIGRACASELAERGFRVLAGVRKEADGDAVRALAPDRIEPLMLDVTDGDAIARLPERVEGDLAGVVNNAGLSIPGPLEYLPMDDVRHQIEVMLLAPFAITQALLPALRRSHGRVVMIGSIGGRTPLPFLGPYNAAKAGVAALADSLRQELAPVGVHVALVEPGSIKTEIWDKGVDAGQKLLDDLPDEGRRVYGERLRATEAAAHRFRDLGIAPAKVAKVVAHALTADKPKTRYLVGIDARGQALLRAALPDRALDRVIGRLSGLG
jgi:NAD(P)-dependent dehydrogenase (short-subunit alcohol dehydrogenase family)